MEEELTSNQANENINASFTTINRQKQEKEEIINRAEVLQEEGQRILDDLSLVSPVNNFKVIIKCDCCPCL